MGITHFEVRLIKKAIALHPITSVVELGAQNMYLHGEDKPPFADSFYKSLGVVEYDCIDLAGDNNAFVVNMAIPQNAHRKYSLVTDFGSSEHFCTANEYETVSFHDGHIHSVYPKNVIETEQAYYNGWKNKHDLLEVGGIMVCVNPKTEHWPQHGFTYLSENFYENLRRCSDYEIIEVGTNCAMGNCETGQNVYAILRKHSELFPSEEMFGLFDYYKS